MSMSRRPLRHLALLLLLPTLGACAWWMAGRGVSLLAKRDLIFDHADHEENGASCEDCHDGVEAATDLAKSFLPKEEACLSCHEREDECQACHEKPQAYKPRPLHLSDIRFSHKAHLARDKVNCATCHQNTMTATALPAGRPNMDTCLACHNHQTDYDQGQCLGCHPTLQQQPLEAVAEYRHVGDWLNNHGLVANNNASVCLQCHQQSTCSDCHSKLGAGASIHIAAEAGIRSSQLHRADFARSHAMEARSGVQMCARCHEERYCSRCHDARGLEDSAALPHPAGYSLPGGEFHGADVRRSPQTCASCHAASDCAECHRVGGLGGNPHPPNFSNDSVRYKSANPSACAVCHPAGVQP